jgi:hypothetical protein
MVEIDLSNNINNFNILEEDYIKIYDLDNLPKKDIYNTLVEKRDKMLLFYIPYNGNLKNNIIKLNNDIKNIIGDEKYNIMKWLISYYVVYKVYGEDISDLDYINFIRNDKYNIDLEYAREYKYCNIYTNPDFIIDDSAINYIQHS